MVGVESLFYGVRVLTDETLGRIAVAGGPAECRADCVAEIRGQVEIVGRRLSPEGLFDVRDQDEDDPLFSIIC